MKKTKDQKIMIALGILAVASVLLGMPGLIIILLGFGIGIYSLRKGLVMRKQLKEQKKS